MSRLAAEVSALTLPAGRVLFEEDAEGNAMYVVVSGACHVRARPLPDVPQRACKGANAVPAVQLAKLGNGGAAGKSLTHGLVSARSGLKVSAKAGRPTSAKVSLGFCLGYIH